MGHIMTNIIEPDTKFTPSINSSMEPQIDWAHASVILGRSRQAVNELGLKGTMKLGVICEHQSTGASLFGHQVLFDNKFPHIIFICGKRGSGKSYTLGVIVEELGRSNSGIGSVVVDPLGTFWTMNKRNKSKKAEDTLSKYGLYPKDFDNIRVLAPIGFYEDLKASVDGAFSIAISDLSVDDWCLVFDINRFKTQGLLIGDVLDKIVNGYDAKIGDVTQKIQQKTTDYTIGDIIFCIQHDVSINSTQEGYALATRRSVIARFRSAAKWGIFSVEGTPINKISIRNKITILDVSHSKLGSSRRALVVGILARKILEARIESARREEASNMGLDVKGKEVIPVTWLVIDEAHLLLPASGKTPATESLIEYAKLGRKPGCGLVFATQRPAATNDDILSQVDTILGHNLALEDDIAALRRRIPAKMPDEFNSSDFIRGIPVGVCLLADQKTQKRTMLVQIRPRMTHHSGKAAMPKPEILPDTLEMKTEILPEHEGSGEVAMELEFEIDSEVESGTEFSADPEQDKEPAKPMDIMQPSIDISKLGLSPEPDEKIRKPVKSKRIKDLDLMSGPDLDDDTETVIEKTKSDYATTTTTTTLGPAPEIDFDIEWGGAYIILTKGSEFALNIFEKLSLSDTSKALSITRTHPSKLNGDTINQVPNRFWLSKTPDKKSVPPGNVTKLAQVINEQLKSSEKSIILLDGLEYLINNNDFPKILKFIETVHENVVLNNGILLVPLNPSAMTDKDFELLVSELSNTISDPILDGGGKRAESAVIDTSISTGISTDTGRTRKPTKQELKDLCSKLGLATTGTVAELKQRLLDYETDIESDDQHAIVEPEKDLEPALDKRKVKEKIKTEKTQEAKALAPEKAAADESVFKELEKERKLLLAERKKLKSELAKLKELAMKRKVDKEKQKLKREQQLLEARKKKLDKRIQKIPKQKPIKPPQKPQRKTTLSGPRARKPKTPILIQRGAHEQLSPFQKSRRQPRGRRGKVSKVMVRRGEPIVETEDQNKVLLIRARLRGAAIEEYAVKQLKTTLLGKPVEAINKITPVYLPLLRVHVKTMRGSIFAKEFTGSFFWDTVTGEIITDVTSVLKRSKGVSTLIRLPPLQAKVLTAVDTWGSNDVVDIQEEIDLPVAQIKRALTELNKKSLVSKDLQQEKRIYNYKRKIELKFPKKFDKVKVDMPRILISNISGETLIPQFKLSDLKKLLNNLSAGTRIVKTEEVYYPYFELDIIGKTGPRIVLLDAISGVNDKYLTEVLQFL
jgi:hypothetical protein